MQRNAEREVADKVKFNVSNVIIYMFAYYLGCGSLWSLDGNWKLTYPICMYQVAKHVQPFSGKLKYVSSCPKQPVTKMAFCEEHCKVAEKQNIPTELHAFLKYQGKSTSTGVSHAEDSDETAADCQGIYALQYTISISC